MTVREIMRDFADSGVDLDDEVMINHFGEHFNISSKKAQTHWTDREDGSKGQILVYFSTTVE